MCPLLMYTFSEREPLNHSADEVRGANTFTLLPNIFTLLSDTICSVPSVLEFKYMSVSLKKSLLLVYIVLRLLIIWLVLVLICRMYLNLLN